MQKGGEYFKERVIYRGFKVFKPRPVIFSVNPVIPYRKQRHITNRETQRYFKFVLAVRNSVDVIGKQALCEYLPKQLGQFRNAYIKVKLFQKVKLIRRKRIARKNSSGRRGYKFNFVARQVFK